MRLSSLPSYLSDGSRIIHKKGLNAIIDYSAFIDDIREVRRYRAAVERLERLNYSSADLANNRKTISGFNNLRDRKIDTINWFLPYFQQVFGGLFTIFRFAEYFSRKGIKNTFVICGKSGTPEVSTAGIIQNITRSFPNLSKTNAIFLEDGNENSLPYADISIATYWETAYRLLKFNKTNGKFYFMQDFEPLFYPADVNYALAEATYRFGFRGITNTAGLYEKYRRFYGGIAEYFAPSVDKQIFYPDNKKSEHTTGKPFSIFFYARPNTPRNGFDLGITALQRIKKKKGEHIRIYTAGGIWDPAMYNLQGKIVNLGILPYEKTADLYRKCDLGLVFMFTEHPSFLPFELMACGCPVITNYNAATTWFFKDKENCILTEPTVTSVCEAIEMLMENKDLRDRLIQKGLNLIRATDWEREMEKIYKFLSNSPVSGRLNQGMQNLR